MKENRIYWLDNLRTFMIFLVVLLHAGIVYESSGSGAFFWIVDDYSTNHLAETLNLILDIFIMPVIFFISGYFSRPALKSKGGWEFLKSKFRRLMFPWIIAVLTLIPLYKFMFLYSRNIPQENWTTYFHWNNGIFSQSWLWFLPVLFLFNIVYFVFSKVKPALPPVTVKSAVWAAFSFGFIYSVCMDMFNWRGWTKTPFLDFQNERLLIYFLIFLLGSLCHKQKTFETAAGIRKLNTILLSTAWLPVVLYLYFYINTVLKPGNIIITETADTLLLWLGFHLSMLCLMFLLVNTFRYHLDGQGKLAGMLSRYSYHVYIIHVIVLGGIAFIMLDLAIPSAVKYVTLVVSTFAACNVIIYIYQKFIKSKIFNRRKPMKTILTAVLTAMLVISAGCGEQKGSAKKEEQSPKPPGVSIHIAALQGNIDAIGQHIKAGSDLNEKDDYGSSPLIIAATFGKAAVAKALIDAGADLKTTNKDGSTPLHIAAFLCYTDIVKALLDNGADKNVKNNFGRTALDSVSGPFEDVKAVYDSLGKGLKQLGLKLDYEQIKETRPKIAEMLQ